MIDDKPVYVFPFRVRYDSVVKEQNDLYQLNVAELAAGYDHTDSDCPFINQRIGTNEANLHSPVYEPDQDCTILGQFGFSRQGGKTTYAHFPRKKKGNKDKRVDPSSLWMRDKDVYFSHTLTVFVDLAGNFANKLELPGQDKSHGLGDTPREQFESILISSSNDNTRVIFRSAFTLHPDRKDEDYGDIRAAEHHWRNKNKYLRLASPISLDGHHDLFLEYGDSAKWRHKRPSSDFTYNVNWIKLDQTVSYKVTQDNLEKYHDEGLIEGKLERSLPFRANDSSKDEILPSGYFDPPDIAGSKNILTMANLFKRGMCSFRLPRLGVASNEAGDAVHALPYSSVHNLSGVYFALHGEVPITFGSERAIEYALVKLKRANWSKFPFELGIYPCDPKRALETRNEQAGRISFTLPGIENVNSGSQPREFTAPLKPSQSNSESGWVQVDIGVPEEQEKAEFDSRIGGLQIGGDRVALLKGSWRFRPAIYIEAPANPDGSQNYAADETDFQITLGVERVEPIGVDRPRQRRDAGETPLLLSIGNSGKSNDAIAEKSPFLITLREEIRRDADRHFTAYIQDTDARSEKQRPYVVLSRQPFSVTALTMEPLQSRGNEVNSNVATYDSDTRTWLFNTVDRRFHYRLPPQGIGESMDKPGWLEIVDDGVDDHGNEVPEDGRPYLKIDEDVTSTALPALRRRVVDYRLTAPAHLWIEPSDLDRNFVVPEWAIYELFRQRGDFGIGARFAGLQAEWIYGLAASIDPAKESGPARGARVAEIEMLLGQVPAAEKEGSGLSEAAQRWNRLRHLIAHRPERLEMWMPNPALDRAFDPARFVEGVRFALRDHAQFRYPFPLRDTDEGKEGRTVLGEDHLNVSRHGLAGGAIWGLESSAFVREFLERPESTGGTIEKVALSPHGGDADFRAEFLNGLLAIIAEVRGGRVQRQRVEIIGRIGVFWNRAKHVVIYERTTSPSAQFTPEGGLGQRTRRPAIRKVEEFIELLQPERLFPDTANADPLSTGFLKATNFNSKVIHVDSAWSEDVGDDGWKIPLWNRLSATQRPSVYPQPDIAFIVHSEGEEAEPLTAQECLDPENLFFYSDAKAATSDTDQWLPVLSVDWTNLPPPSHAQQQSVDGRASAEHSHKPGAQRFPRGQRRFTWRLAPSSRRAKLNHGREGKPIYARLDTLTFSRATADLASDDVKKFDNTMKIVSEELAPDKFAPVEQAMAEFRKAAERGDKRSVEHVAKALQAVIDKVEYPDLFGNDASNTFKDFKELAEQAKRSPAKCHKMVDDFIGGLQRKRLLFLANLNEWKADADAVITDIGDQPDRETWIKAAVVEVRKAIAPGLEGARADLGNSRSQVEQARSIVADMAADARARIARAESELEEAYRAYHDNKPWSPARLKDCQRQMESARAGLIADVEAALADARQRLATETQGLAQKLGRATAAEIDAAARAEGGLLTHLGTAETAMQAVVNDAQEKFQGKAKALTEALAEAAEKADKIPDGNPLKAKIKLALAEARTEIGTAIKLLTDRFDQLRADIAKGRTELGSTIKTVADLLAGVLQDFETAVGDAIVQLDAAISEAGDLVNGELKCAIEQSRNLTAVLSTDLTAVFDQAQSWAQGPENYLNRIKEKLKETLSYVDGLVVAGNEEIGTQLSTIEDTLQKLNEEIATDKVLQHIEGVAIRPAFDRVVPVDSYATWKGKPEEVAATLEDVVAEIDALLQMADGDLQRRLASLQAAASTACDTLQAGVDGIEKALKDAIFGNQNIPGIHKELKNFAAKFDTQEFKDALNDIAKLREWTNGATEEFGVLRKQASDVRAQYDAYADRVIEEVGNIGKGGIAAAPNNLLRLWAAAASAPEMPNLDYTRERLGYYYRELNNVIDTTPAEAFFARLGSELKAMGVTLPFEQFDRKMVMLDPSKYDIGSVLNRFCGMDWSKLFKGSKLPASARDAIRLTHDLDEKSFRAWAQVDINLPMPGRRSLFTVGPFKLDFVDMQLLGQVRLEASKDTDRVAQSGHAQMVTTIDAVVSGQSMVQLRKVVLEFDKHGKLDVQIDPKNIKINPALEFVQQALAELFPDEIGGMQVIKQDGLPVGVEHVYSMPPISIMGGTSGISNLAISNRFALLAYPDFVIANRFALSRPDMPFLFTIFVIGGSGYILVDAEYRPFNSELAVSVEAAAGGSAALGFSLGPVNGSVYVSLSVALSYRKVIGRRGGGLTVSVLLVIAGNVDVAGLARVNLTLILRMYYRSNSQIDGLGTVSVSFRVTRWFKYRYRKNYQKTLRKGRPPNQQLEAQRAGPSRAQQMMEARK